MKAVRRTLPYSATRPTSFRPRSTSIRCSARSFGSAASSAASAASSSGLAPRGRVPAIGPERDLAILDPDQDLGRAADDLDVVAVEVVEIGRGVERPEIAVGEERVGRRDLEPPRQYRLEGVARRDVLLDAAHVVLEALVRIGRRGRRQRARKLDGERPDRAAEGEAAEPVVDAGLGGGVEPAQLGVVGLGVHLHVRDDRGPIVQVVQHEQRVGHHHQGVRQVAIVGRRIGERLDRADDVVAQIAHRAAGEPGEPRHVHRRVPAKQRAQMLERRRRRSRRRAILPGRSSARSVGRDSGTLREDRSPGRCTAPTARRPRAIRAGSRTVRDGAWRRRTRACRRRARPRGSPAPSRRPCGRGPRTRRT